MTEESIEEVRQERDELCADLAENELNLMKQEAAVAAGLDVSQAHRLNGDTREELLADAREFVGDLQRAAESVTTVESEAKSFTARLFGRQGQVIA